MPRKLVVTHNLVKSIALAVLLAGCVWAVGGLHDGRPWGNGTPYFDSLKILGGQVPYRDFFLEYPPLAIPVFLAPHAVAGDGLAAYLHVFKLLMAVFAVLCLLGVDLIASRLRLSPLRRGAALALVALMPAALGQYVLNRYDLWPALLLVGLLLALLDRRAATSGVLLAAGVAAKTFPLALVPVAAIRLGRASLRRAVVAAVATLVVIYAYFLVAAPHGLAVSYKVQLTRHLETESLGASLLLAADRLGLYHAHVIAGNPGSIDLAGTLPRAVAALTSVVAVAAVLWIAWLYKRRGHGLVLATAATLVAFVLFTKVLSPQYLIWLVPVVPLVGSLVADGLLLLALLLSQFPGYGFDGLHISSTAVALLVARNLVLLSLLAWLVRALLRPGRDPTP
jgi:glycosyl transferase family 87